MMTTASRKEERGQENRFRLALCYWLPPVRPFPYSQTREQTVIVTAPTMRLTGAPAFVKSVYA